MTSKDLRLSSASTESALREIEARMDKIQEIAHLGVWELDHQTGQLVWSDEVYRIFGLIPQELTATYEVFLDLVHPDDRASVDSAHLASIQYNKDSYETEHRLIRKHSGEVRYVHEKCERVKDASGNIIRSLGMVQDITERKQAEQMLLESNFQLKEARNLAESASRAKSEFLSRMSHELRTPMNAIIGFTQLLEDNPVHPLSEDQRDSLHEISTASTRLLGLINEVLDLARIESGRLVLSLEPLEPGELCRECLGQHQPLAQDRGITMAVNVPSGLRIHADRVRLRQVLLNLISNGIKYNREGGEVEVGCAVQADNLLRIWVRDTGPGIDQEFLPRMFQPFERAAGVEGLIEGTGIGLTLAKSLTEAMGGTIGFETDSSRGSTFWIELPQAGRMEDMEASSDAPTVPLPASVARERRVLYIEDNPANMRLVKKIMSGLGGVTLLMAESAEAGLELVKSCLPHLILMDINLPGMDGFQALDRLRRNPETRDIPVVAVTASAMSDQVKKVKNAGFDDCLTKPINLQRFVAVVNALLKKPFSENGNE